MKKIKRDCIVSCRLAGKENKEKLQQIAKEKGITLSVLLEQIINDYLK